MPTKVKFVEYGEQAKVKIVNYGEDMQVTPVEYGEQMKVKIVEYGEDFKVKIVRDTGACFITTACVEAAGLPDNCIELETMRCFRDEYLANSLEGRRMIKEYYQTAPSIVKAIRREENSDVVFADIFRQIKEIVSLINSGDLENAITYYKEMVLRLKQQYQNNL